jgi:hypothetical protein
MWNCGVVNLVVHNETASFALLIALRICNLKQNVIISMPFNLSSNNKLNVASHNSQYIHYVT